MRGRENMEQTLRKPPHNAAKTGLPLSGFLHTDSNTYQ